MRKNILFMLMLILASTSFGRFSEHVRITPDTEKKYKLNVANGTFTTVANTNSVLVTSSSDVRFWRVRRETGVSQ